MKFYHISKNGNIDLFIPRVPASASATEDKIVKRVCIAPTIEGCVSAAPLVDDVVNIDLFIYEFDIDLCDPKLIRDKTLFETGKVFDCLLTHEHWYLDELKPDNKYPIKITDYEISCCFAFGITSDYAKHNLNPNIKLFDEDIEKFNRGDFTPLRIFDKLTWKKL